MEKLEQELQHKIIAMKRTTNGAIDFSTTALDDLYSVYPFNKFEFVISHLIASETINLNEYLDIRNAYLERNKYLYLFEITAPRTFGESWAQRHLNEIVPELERPTNKLDPHYNGQYDFWLADKNCKKGGIRIEVKASRAVKRKSGDSLIIKALSSDSVEGFDMNFQQIKPACCDVFVWIAVWRDKIRYFVLSSDEVASNKYYSIGQHRGNVGEGQLWLKESNIAEFKIYEVGVREILKKIKERGGK
ncbi:hypothetical protein [Helicobacter sp. T3_23-1056]